MRFEHCQVSRARNVECWPRVLYNSPCHNYPPYLNARILEIRIRALLCASRTSTFLKCIVTSSMLDRKSAVFGSVVVGRHTGKECTLTRPRTNDEWIRFTDKPTINHRPIVYQQTGRIRMASWILLLDFFTSYGRMPSTPRGITEFYPFLRYS